MAPVLQPACATPILMTTGHHDWGVLCILLEAHHVISVLSAIACSALSVSGLIKRGRT